MNIWADAKEIVGTVAPALASLMGGPLVGTAVGQIVNVLGLTPEASPADVTAALKSATPDQLLALRKADQAFQIQLKDIDIEWEKLADADTADARARQTAVHDPYPSWLGTFIIVAFVGVVVMVLAGWAKADSVLAGTLIGYISAKADQVISYFFGSSSGSKAKDAMLYASTPSVPTPKVPASQA